MITTTDEFGGGLLQSSTHEISKKDRHGEAYCKLILARESILRNPGAVSWVGGKGATKV